ncbi:MAG: exodeoxyribonuclease VII large subunit [Lachnospiraceae bacterium]|nr:exodeoxyribonuclease VII large subunit [Lachnospiraceae bacterium]
MAGIYSVSQVNSYIKNMFAQDFALSRIAVRGEISNCKYHTSGHIYFTLKDKSGTLSAVMFASQRRGLSFQLQEGQQVVVSGSVDVYERDGKYQLYARSIELDGTGDLYARFQKLRDELEEMGMFAAEYKRPIPKYAQKIGVVTASTGAAIRDIMNITHRRNPYVQLVLYPALVQGAEAAGSIAAGIRVLDARNLDVLIVGRGGGSMEDLWAFNEELVAQAIFNCRTPVISAVGHETDVTIADYVADLRAPTPSAAAELAVFDYRQFEEQRMACQAAICRGMERQLEQRRHRIEQYRLQLRLHDPERQLNEKRKRLADLEEHLQAMMEHRILEARHRLALTGGRLHGLSPLEKISRGYGFLTDAAGKRIEHIRDVRKEDPITIRILDGRIEARVTGVEELE